MEETGTGISPTGTGPTAPDAETTAAVARTAAIATAAAAESTAEVAPLVVDKTAGVAAALPVVAAALPAAIVLDTSRWTSIDAYSSFIMPVLKHRHIRQKLLGKSIMSRQKEEIGRWRLGVGQKSCHGSELLY